MKVSEVLQGMIEAFNPGQAKGVNATVQLNTLGEGGGAHIISIANGKATWQEGTAPDPTVTITVSAQDWLDIVTGKLDATKAFMTGRLKISGDMNLMMRFQRMFG
jgi:putative sterol carrier protein